MSQLTERLETEVDIKLFVDRVIEFYRTRNFGEPLIYLTLPIVEAIPNVLQSISGSIFCEGPKQPHFFVAKISLESISEALLAIRGFQQKILQDSFFASHSLQTQKTLF